MSRIKLDPKDDSHEVIVGYDRPFSTFFITVMHKQSDDDLEDLPAIEFKDRWRRGDVIAKIDEYAKPTERTVEAKKAIFLDVDPEQFVKTPLE